MILNFREIVFAAGLAASALCAGAVCAEEAQATDVRVPVLKNFFSKYRSPLAAHAEEFLRVSDQFGLDWRLMPSLVIIESGGRNIRNNNVFGWGNGASRFRSVVDSISVVANCLANQVPYRGKSLEEKMRVYNPRNRNYPAFVQRMMDKIAPLGDSLAAAGPAVAVN